ncbi:MAG: ATP-binding protein [Pseudomonadales bacterium]|nr:ATP-binding protein [Pseudomonadales bacterium]
MGSLKILNNKTISTSRSFTIFVMASMLLLSTVLLTFVWFSLQKTLTKQRVDQIDITVDGLSHEMNNYIKVRFNEFKTQSQFPIMNQAVMQPEQNIENLKDFFVDLFIQRKQYQQKILDFSGKVLYQRFADNNNNNHYADAIWFNTLSNDITSNSQRLITSDKNYFELVIPIVYNNYTEGFFILELPFTDLKSNLNLKNRFENIEISLLNQQLKTILTLGSEIKGDMHISKDEFFGLKLAYQYNQNEITANTFSFLQNLFYVLIFFAFTISLIAAFLGNRYFVHPILKLTQHTLEMTKGHTTQISLPKHVPSEFLILIQNFNHMVNIVGDRESKLKLAYEQLKDNQLQLMQADKMASLGTLAAGVAHEINNPLAFITNNIQTLDLYFNDINTYYQQSKNILGDLKNNDQATKTINLIQDKKIDFIVDDITDLINDCNEGLVRVKDIVASLNQFSRKDMETPSTFNLRENIEKTVKMIKHEIKYNSKIKINIIDECQISGFSGQINQVLINILMNAQQSIVERGVVERGVVEKGVAGKGVVEKGIAEKGLIDIYLKKEKSYAIISIIDNGCGIKEENIVKLFDPFFTSKPVGEGTGLGLSISYGIIKSHKGKIEVTSKIGLGTTFKISLPM